MQECAGNAHVALISQRPPPLEEPAVLPPLLNPPPMVPEPVGVPNPVGGGVMGAEELPGAGAGAGALGPGAGAGAPAVLPPLLDAPPSTCFRGEGEQAGGVQGELAEMHQQRQGSRAHAGPPPKGAATRLNVCGRKGVDHRRG